jgi:hypothetical protein
MGRGYISNGPVTRFRFVGSVLPSARFLVVVSIYFHLCECKPGERKALDLSAYALENLNYRKSFSHLLYFSHYMRSRGGNPKQLAGSSRFTPTY